MGNAVWIVGTIVWVVWNFVRVVKAGTGCGGDVVVGVSGNPFGVADLLIMDCGWAGGWLAGECLIRDTTTVTGLVLIRQCCGISRLVCFGGVHARLLQILFRAVIRLPVEISTDRSN